MIFAKKNEIVTCINGHAMFKFKRDVHFRERFDSNHVEWINEKIDMPKTGTPYNDCFCHCGGRYMTSTSDKIILHFEDTGWSE